MPFTHRPPAADLLVLDGDGRPGVSVLVRKSVPDWYDGWDEVEAELLSAAEEDGSRFALLLTGEEVKVWERAGNEWGLIGAHPATPLVRPLVELAASERIRIDDTAFRRMMTPMGFILMTGRRDSMADQFRPMSDYVREYFPGVAAVFEEGQVVTEELLPSSDGEDYGERFSRSLLAGTR